MSQQQLLIPMAGLGVRFRDAGWTTRKPFIPVDGVPMARRVLETMQLPEEQLSAVCLREDAAATRALFPRAHAVVPIEYQPDGTTLSVLAALPALDPRRPVLVANADQVVEWDLEAFLAKMDAAGAAAGVLTFRETERSAKWSYVVADDDGVVREVVAKRPVSDLGVVGVYWYRTAALMERAMRAMIAAGDRTKGEFYVCPSLNYVDGVVAAFPCAAMRGVGTPEDLERYARPRSV